MKKNLKIIAETIQFDRDLFFYALPISEELKSSPFYRMKQFSLEQRRLSWAAGRECLYRVLLDCGESVSVEDIRWPHRQYSLSHTDDIAIAVGTLSPSFGIGIDIEKRRDLNSNIKKFFINRDEECYLSKIDLLTFWVIKESCYKADLKNSYHRLKSYCIKDIQDHFALLMCKGGKGESDGFYEVRWRRWQDYFLSVAIKKEI